MQRQQRRRASGFGPRALGCYRAQVHSIDGYGWRGVGGGRGREESCALLLRGGRIGRRQDCSGLGSDDGPWAQVHGMDRLWGGMSARGVGDERRSLPSRLHNCPPSLALIAHPLPLSTQNRPPHLPLVALPSALSNHLHPPHPSSWKALPSPLSTHNRPPSLPLIALPSALRNHLHPPPPPCPGKRFHCPSPLSNAPLVREELSSGGKGGG